MDPSRKRKLRLVLALSAAVLLAGALVYTSFSASTEASTPSDVVASAEPGRSYELTGKVVKDSVARDGDRLKFAIRDRDGTTSVPVVYEGVVPGPVPRGPRGDRLGRAGEGHVRRRARLARHQVPLEVHRRTRAPPDMADVGSACLLVGLLTALYAAGVSVYGAVTGRRALVTSGRRAIYCLAGLLIARHRRSSSRPSCARTSRYKLVAEGSSTDTPTFYKVTAMWATQDGSLLLWALLHVDLLERGAVPHPRARCATSRRGRPACSA